eukprot:CAMPEP_0197258160 /NCGR_PEP_ID=MMETSP1429-20130617/81126_1 /TAXON_ID=49237 /ORGANISM="Chaetoceros  sp., Strain UNC1202" /LENGTH=256 /DNA_ID=CAMNT_0042722193 /DNA_START=12 /DNA_END=782 /DNA_ORIENTATION=+
MKHLSPFVFVSLLGASSSFAPTSTCTNVKSRNAPSLNLFQSSDETDVTIPSTKDRRQMIASVFTGATATAAALVFSSPEAASALVEGNPTPTKKKSLPEEYMQGSSALANMDSNAAVPDSAYSKLPSGVIIADLRQGSGDLVGDGSRVNLQWVLRKSNGYFVDSSEVQNGVPFIFTVGDKTAIAGIDEGVRGMRQGGTRRILIPPSLAFVDGLDDGKPGPMPAGYGPRQQMRRVQTIRKDVPGEYIFIEVQVTRVR